jgi:hypothetical protein
MQQNKIQSINTQYKNNRLFQLPGHLLSYVYSFDPTFREQLQTKEFHLQILAMSGESYRIINKYLKGFFSEGYIWINTYGVFTTIPNFTMNNMPVHREYKFEAYLDEEKECIGFYLLPCSEINFEEIEEKRYDGFLTHDGEYDDPTYIGVQTHRLGKLLHLYVDDV